MKKLQLLFLLCIGLVFTGYGQELMSIDEVFDFEPQDEFHWELSATNGILPNAERIKILEKYYSESEDTLFYRVYDFSFHTNLVGGELEYYFTDDTLIWAFPNPQSSIAYYDTCFNHDTIIDTHDCGRITNGYHYQEGEFEPAITDRTYGAGIGLCYQYISEGSNDQGISRNMIYYKKGDETCGTGNFTTALKCNLMDTEKMSIYPNPCQNDFRIDIPETIDENALVEIYNMEGKLVRKLQLSDSQFEGKCIHIRNFNEKTGIYLCRYKDWSYKFIKN